MSRERRTREAVEEHRAEVKRDLVASGVSSEKADRIARDSTERATNLLEHQRKS